MFENIQVDNIKDYITKETTVVIDADGLAYLPASIVQELYIEVKNNISGETKEFKNLTEFKGRTKTISGDSWLGSLNFKREASGNPKLDLSDFTITQKQRERLPFSVATKAIDSHIKQILEAVKCNKYILLLGSGKTHRNKIPLPFEYKGNRDNTLRPLELSYCRQYMKDNYNCEEVIGIESDDRLTQYGMKGYLAYKETGKFSYIISSNDKDALCSPSLLFNWDKSDNVFKHTKPFLIKEAGVDVGGVDLIKGKVKGYGLLWLCCQILAGDSSDNYFAFKNTNTDYSLGDKALYLKLVNVKTPKEALSVVVDCYKEAYPNGVDYIDFSGTHQKLTWLEWADMQFKCAYMLRVENDTTTFEKLLKHFKVDY
jgi:hypothetical protein